MTSLRFALAVNLLQLLLLESAAYYGSSSSSSVNGKRKNILESAVYYNGPNVVHFETVVNATNLQLLQCRIIANRKIASLKIRDSMISSTLTEQQFKAKVLQCENVTSSSFKAILRDSRFQPHPVINYQKLLGDHLYSTYPGTKWCGTGVLATTNSELGTLRPVDKCCRDHARCFDTLQPGEVRHGLENRDFFGRKHCRCDQRLFRCLKQLSGEDAELVGHLYFNILQIECFEEDLPKICTGYDHDGLCNDYDYPGGSLFAPRYQWFANPPFKIDHQATKPV